MKRKDDKRLYLEPFEPIFRMVYYVDIKLVHAFIFIIPCMLITLFKIWTKLVAKSQAEIISRKLNEELVKLV